MLSSAAVSACPWCGSKATRQIGVPWSPRRYRFGSTTVLLDASLARRCLADCSSCGLRRYLVTPTDDAVRRMYSLEEADDRWERGRGEAQVSKLLGTGTVRADAALEALDIGCHTGRFVAAMPPTWRGYGVDLDSAALASARAAVPSARFYEGPFEKISIPAESLDLITAWDVVEHLDNVRGFFEHVAASLKPRGIFAFETGDFSSPYASFAGLAWYYYGPLDHTVFFSPKIARTFCGEYGFDIVMLKRTSHESDRASDTRSLLLSLSVPLVTFSGRVTTPLRAVLSLLGKQGSLPAAPFGDHMFVVARKR